MNRSFRLGVVLASYLAVVGLANAQELSQLPGNWKTVDPVLGGYDQFLNIEKRGNDWTITGELRKGKKLSGTFVGENIHEKKGELIFDIKMMKKPRPDWGNTKGIILRPGGNLLEFTPPSTKKARTFERIGAPPVDPK